MNPQTSMSNGQVPNQSRALFEDGSLVLPAGLLRSQHLVSGVGSAAEQRNMVIDVELLRGRGEVRDRIYSITLRRFGMQEAIDERTKLKARDISKCLEERLYNSALTKEEYLNMDTLEDRLCSILRK